MSPPSAGHCPLQGSIRKRHATYIIQAISRG